MTHKTAVILIETSRLGISTPSLATRAPPGDQWGRNLAYVFVEARKVAWPCEQHEHVDDVRERCARPARRIASQLTSACCVCSWMVVPMS